MNHDTIIRLEARIAALKDALLAVEEVMGSGSETGRRIDGLLQITEERLERLLKESQLPSR